MKQQVNFSDFVEGFKAYDRYDQFGYAALRALFDYMEELEEDCGTEFELDVIALCCDWTAYASAVEAFQETGDSSIEIQKTVYTAGWNMPGYMPDSEPVQFDDADDAREYIAEQMEDYADSIEDAADDDADSVEALRAIAEQVRDGSGELGATVAGWHYWITAETVENEDAEEQCLEWLRDQTQVIAFDASPSGKGGILVGAF